MNILEILITAIVAVGSVLGGTAFIILLWTLGIIKGIIKDMDAEIEALKSKKE